MGKKGVKMVYAIFNAKWYDFFKNIWNKIVAKNAEKEFTKFLNANLNEGKNLLDVGCGTAKNLEKITKLNIKLKSYTGLDFSPDMLAIAKKKFPQHPNVAFIQKDISELKEVDKKFDVITCTWVLSHLDAPAEAVNQMQHLLKPKGKLFLIFFTKPKWYINFWMGFAAKYLFKSRYVTDEDMAKFGNIKKRQSFSANMATIIEI